MERAYTVRVHRGPLAPEVAEAGLGKELPEADEIVTVRASRDGLANTHAMHQTTLEFSGHLAEVYEVMDDGSERRLYINA